MHELNPHEDFEPSRDTKSIWRWTRKSESRYGGVTLPGLFQTSHFFWDTSGFLLVIVLELWGLRNLLVVGDIAFTYVAGLFLADVVFAVCCHLPRARICEYRNRLVVIDDDLSPAEKLKAEQNIVRRIRLRKLAAFLLAVPIVGIAAAKIVGFFAIQGGEFDGLTAMIILSYGLAAALHIVCTGHFLFAMATSTLLGRDHNAYLASQGRLAPRTHTFSSSAQIQETRVDRHRLYRDPDAPQRCTIQTIGLLEDRQLQSLVFDQQDPTARVQVAREGLKHQLAILEQAPRTDAGGTGLKAGAGSAAGAAGAAMIAVLLLGCPAPPGRVEAEVPFSMSIVLTEPPGKPAGELPADIKELALPLQTDDCLGVTFTPRVSLVRADLEPVNTADIEVEDGGGFITRIQRILKAKKTEEQIRRTMNSALSRYRIPDELAAPLGDASRGARALAELEAQGAAESGVWVYGGDADWLPGVPHERAFSECDRLREQVAADLCARRKREESRLRYVLVYNPRGGPDKTQEPKLVRDGENGQGQEVSSIRANLEEGKLRAAHDAVQAQLRESPERPDLLSLRESIESDVNVRIEVKVRGQSGHHLQDAEPSMVPLHGGEEGFRLFVEPHEDVYLYLYAEYSGGHLVPLFPSTLEGEEQANPLAGESGYYLPPTGLHAFRGSAGELKTTHIVASRWRARDLEDLNADLQRGQADDAALLVLKALEERKTARVGGCWVRAVEFERNAG